MFQTNRLKIPLTPALSHGGERERVVAPPSMGGVGEGDGQAAEETLRALLNSTQPKLETENAVVPVTFGYMPPPSNRVGASLA